MPTHHQKLDPLDQPATRRDLIRAMVQMSQAWEARMAELGKQDRAALAEEWAQLEAHICEDER